MILQFKDTLRLTVKPVGPELCSGRCVDQLRANAKLLANGPQTTLDDIADPKLSPDLAAIDRTALVGKSGLLGDYDEGIRASIVIKSSLIASVRNLNSRSSEKQVKGSTTMEGFSVVARGSAFSTEDFVDPAKNAFA